MVSAIKFNIFLYRDTIGATKMLYNITKTK